MELLEAMISMRFSGGGIRTSAMTLRVVGDNEKGSLNSERVKDGQDQRKTTLVRASSIYERQTRPLVREDAPQKQDRNCQKVINTWS
jgi:hypothetical protein